MYWLVLHSARCLYFQGDVGNGCRGDRGQYGHSKGRPVQRGDQAAVPPPFVPGGHGVKLEVHVESNREEEHEVSVNEQEVMNLRRAGIV